MSIKKMFIPDKINVGYQKRDGTYTGKLAYVTYIDEKGKLRKEKSWNQWCDNNIQKDEFVNDLTDGFVLNKKVGDHNWGWNGRKAWCRIYDPRGFEFEITVENLLFILEECTSVKGKGLEGKFVYAWDGVELVLLPVSSQEYSSCKNFTDCKSLKIDKKDMIEGHVYLTKNMEEVIYIGRNEWFEPFVDISDNYDIKKTIISKGKKHVFYKLKQSDKEISSLEDKYKIYSETGFTKIARKISDIPHVEYPKIYDLFKKSINGSYVKKVIIKNKDVPELVIKNNSWSRFLGINDFIIENDKIYVAHIRIKRDAEDNYSYDYYQSKKPIFINEKELIIPDDVYNEYHGYSHYFIKNNANVSKKYILSKQFCDLFFLTESDSSFKIFPNKYY